MCVPCGEPQLTCAVCVGAAQIGWHKDASGKIDGYIKELGQTKVDRLQIGERKVHRCRSDCTGELAVGKDGKVDGAKACSVHLLLAAKTATEKRLGAEINEAVFADYCVRENPPRGATVVVTDEDSELLTEAYQPKHEAFRIITKAQDEEEFLQLLVLDTHARGARTIPRIPRSGIDVADQGEV